VRVQAAATRTVPAQVRKSFAVKSRPLIARTYALTSAEPTPRVRASSST